MAESPVPMTLDAWQCLCLWTMVILLCKADVLLMQFKYAGKEVQYGFVCMFLGCREAFIQLSREMGESPMLLTYDAQMCC